MKFFASISLLLVVSLIGNISSAETSSHENSTKSQLDGKQFPGITPDSEKVVEQALRLKLDENQQWLNLFNYRRDFFFWKRSQADSPLFFVSGSPWSARDELVATIRAFFDPEMTRVDPEGKLSERFQCIFPGRYLWLKRNLKDVRWPEVECQRFENFKAIVDTHSVTYVFSSYFLNNPSSAYGHSFLRLNKTERSYEGKKYELIDFGMGYVGVPVSGSILINSAMGLLGLFPGRFETMPYYYKVREYNDFENRDLWEYDLDLTPDEVSLLIGHIYELQNAAFNYIYFTENCAYRILAILDTLRPELNLIKRSKPLDIIPGDTMKLVAETPGLVRKLNYRPSGRAIFFARQNTLNESEQKKLAQFIQDENVENLVGTAENDTEKRELLDAAMDYLDFRFADDIVAGTGKFALKKQVLIKRSEVSQVSPPLNVPVPERSAPSEAHGSSRWSLGYLSDNSHPVATIGRRFALHDMLDPMTGFLPGSEIQMFNFNFTWALDREHRFQLDDFHLMKLESLSPRDLINQHKSWLVDLSWNRRYQDNCVRDCLPFNLVGGVGLTKQYVGILTSVWLKGALAYSSEFARDKFILGAGPAFLANYYYTDRLSVLAEAWYRYDYKAVRTDFRESSLGAQVNYSRDLGLRLLWRSDRQYRAEVNYYF